MAKPTLESLSGRHQTLWRVEARRWLFAEYATPSDRLLALKRERGPGIEQGETVERTDVPSRAAAIELACRYLQRHAEEAVGRSGLAVDIRPPEFDRREPSLYAVPAEVASRARELGLTGDVTVQIQRMVAEADLSAEGGANLEARGYLLRIERGVVTWIGSADNSRRHRRGSRST